MPVLSSTLNHLGLIAVNGQNAAQFLQGQLTCDVREVNSEASRLGAHCNPKGRILFSFRLLKIKEQYVFCLPQAMLASAITTLNKYALFSKTSLSNVSNDYTIIALAGTAAEEFLRQRCLTLKIDPDASSNLEELVIIKLRGPEPCYKLIGPSAAVLTFCQQLPSTISLLSSAQWQLQELLAGIATIMPETSGLFTPHQVNYPLINAVSFNKGCYTGQEIVARMQYLGTLKQHLYPLRFNADHLAFAPGSPISTAEGEEVGNLVNSINFDNHSSYGLAVLNDSAITIPLYISGISINIVTPA